MCWAVYFKDLLSLEAAATVAATVTATAEIKSWLVFHPHHSHIRSHIFFNVWVSKRQSLNKYQMNKILSILAIRPRSLISAADGFGLYSATDGCGSD